MNKTQFLASAAPDIQEFDIPGMPEKVRIRLLSGRARDAFQATVQAGDKSVSYFEAAVVISAVVDETGAPLFTADDLEPLRDVSTGVIGAIARRALDLNKIGPDAEEAAAKN